ncbi:MAG: DNA-protecting protein DprA [Desulfuromusa sp.]|nr:DNA-protecting protein DprA [Desulfuromusa sp.]
MMDNLLTEDTQAIILLSGVFGKDRSEKPLSLAEYSSLVRWLIEMKMRPGDLLQQENIAEASMGSGIDKQRLESLLGRGVQLGFAVEEWQRNGIWIISRSDADYPVRYKKHLKDKAPPLLFGVGNRALLSGGGLGIVGSRNVDQEGEAFTRQVAELCVYNRMPVVSGGARGVDQISMTAALETGGITIGILAENLLKKSVERKNRHAIADGRLLLLSPYHPNARFTVGTAMGRNKLIYAMADYALVVSADHKKGGTWVGATEELKRDKSIAVFVRTGENVPSGNMKLLDLGAQEWPANIGSGELSTRLADLADQRSEQTEAEPETLNLFDFQSSPASVVTQKPEEKLSEQIQPKAESVVSSGETQPNTVYEAVMPVLLPNLKDPVSVDDLSARVDVAKGQLNVWLKKAVADGVVKKHKNPVLYSAKRE